MAAGLTRESLQVEVRLIETAPVVTVNGNSKGLPVLESDYQVGRALDFELQIVDGAPQVRLDGDLLYQGQAGDIKDGGGNDRKTGPGASATGEREEQAKGDDADQKPAPRGTTALQRTRPTTPPPAKVASPAAKVEPSGYADAALITTAQGKGKAIDAAEPEREVTVHGGVATTTAPDGSPAVVLSGREDYLEVADPADLSIATTGQLTVEMPIRPDVVAGLPDAEASGDGPMVQPLVKGSTFGSEGDQEYAMRLYDQDSDRPSRTSAYAFDPAGGDGAGSYAQQSLEAGQWVHLSAVYDTTAGKDTKSTVTLYRDGVKVDADTLGGDHNVTPTDSDSPLFIGGDGQHSAFTGAIGAVVIYPTAISGKQVAAHAGAALTPADKQGTDAAKSKGRDAGNGDDAGKSSGGGEQQDEPATGARPIPVPDENS